MPGLVKTPPNATPVRILVPAGSNTHLIQTNDEESASARHDHIGEERKQGVGLLDPSVEIVREVRGGGGAEVGAGNELACGGSDLLQLGEAGGGGATAGEGDRGAEGGRGAEYALAKFSGYMQLGDTHSMLGQLDRSIACYDEGLKIQMEAIGETDLRVAETCR
ncbi:hypothetical protein AAC387_Pa08g1638 [Persea americana]